MYPQDQTISKIHGILYKETINPFSDKPILNTHTQKKFFMICYNEQSLYARQRSLETFF